MSPQTRTRFEIDWANPDYTEVFKFRADALAKLREQPGSIKPLMTYYSTRWAEFISDWMMTYDPRKLATGQPTTVPFVLFPKQVEFVDWTYARWRAHERGLASKCRDVGFSWLACACAVCVWLFYPHANIGFGSRKKESVDNGDGDPDSLFWKVRKLIALLPAEFVPAGYPKGNKWGLVLNPENGSTIKGEVGDSIGMGGRTTISFIDEADALEHQQLVEASLAGTTDCRIDISTENQVGSVFYTNKRSLPARQVFEFDWWEDPRKRLHPELPPTEEPWYKKKKAELNPTTFASQILRNPNAALANTIVSAGLIEEAEARRVSRIEQSPQVGWRIGIDASGMGNDLTVIWRRRGRISLPVVTFERIDGVQLAAQVEGLAKDLLKLAPLELVAIEQDGPGGSCADQLAYSPLAPVLRAVHTGKRLQDGKHYNLRAWLHTQAKTYLEEAEPFLPPNPTFKSQATALLFEYKGGLLLVESKDDYRKRLSGSNRKAEKMSSRSPDHWDAFMLTFVPQPGPPLRKFDTTGAFTSGPIWRPMDAAFGY